MSCSRAVSRNRYLAKTRKTAFFRVQAFPSSFSSQQNATSTVEGRGVGYDMLE
jgi:hypothetical protein